MNGCLLLLLIVRLLVDVAVRDGLMGRLGVHAFYPCKVVATCRAGMSKRVVQGSFFGVISTCLRGVGCAAFEH